MTSKQTLYGLLSEKRDTVIKNGKLIYISPDTKLCFLNTDSLKTVFKSLCAYKRSPNSQELKKGDLITIFNSIRKGDVLWRGTINLEYNLDTPVPHNDPAQVTYGIMRIRDGFQKGLTPHQWGKMFQLELPAILKKQDGAEIHGLLMAHFEMGFSNVVWSIHEFDEPGKPAKGYDGTHEIKNGDELTVYRNIKDGNIYWQGSFDGKKHDTVRKNGRAKSQSTRTVSPEKDASLLKHAFSSRYPIRIIRNTGKGFSQ